MRKCGAVRSVCVFATVFLLFVSFSGSNTVSAVETEVFLDNFDDGVIDDWQRNVATGNTLAVSTNNDVSPPYSLKVTKLSTVSGPARATSKYIQLNYDADYIIELKFYLTSTVTQKGMLIADDGRVYAWVTPTAIGNTLELIGAGYTLYDIPISLGVPYTFRACVYPADGYYDVLMNGGAYNWQFVAKSVGFRYLPLKHLSIGTDEVVGTKHYGEVYFDDIVCTGARGDLFCDNFNEGAISDWSVTKAGTAIVSVTTTKYYSSPSSLYIKYAGTLNPGRATTPSIECDFTQDYTVSERVYVYNYKYVVLADNGKLEVIDMAGNLYAVTSTANVLICPMTSSVWHSLEFRAHPSIAKFDVLLDGVAKGTYSFKTTAGANKISVGSKVTPGSKDSGEAYWDDIAVIKGIPSPDSDGDGLSNSQEISLGTDPYGIDKWALVVCGGIGDDLQDNFERTTDRVYRMLRMSGYSSDHITYFSSEEGNTARDADGDGLNDIDGLSSLAAIRSKIASWSFVIDRDDRVFIYMCDHGVETWPYTGDLVLHVHDNPFPLPDTHDTINALQLDAMLDVLYEDTLFDRLVCIIDCCYSGVWINDGDANIKGTNRLVMSGTDSDEVGYCGWLMLFTDDLLDKLEVGTSVEDAFTYADACRNASNTPQDPQISDQCNPATNPQGEVYP